MQITQNPDFIYRHQQSLVFTVAAVVPTIIIGVCAFVTEALLMLAFGEKLTEFRGASLFMPVCSAVYILFGKIAVPSPHAAFLWSLWRFGKHWGPQVLLSVALVFLFGDVARDKATAGQVLASAYGLTVYWWPAYGFGALFLFQLRLRPRPVEPPVSREPIEDDDEDFFAY